MYSFHISIHGRPASARAGPPLQLRGRDYATLVFDREELTSTPLAGTFETAAAALAALGRLYCEPDGSFVWVSSQGQPSWQVDGNLYDRSGRLLFVDAKGTCPADQFDRLIAAFGWPQTPLMFQLVRQAVFLDELTFRQQAEADFET
jgi:hypothetical protein